MKSFSDKADFQVRWLPFQLNPAAPGGQGVNKLEMYRQKFGEARMSSMLPMMIATGKKEGINFSYGGNTGNTFDSHRLISLAAKQGRQDEMVEELFRNYFEEEKCISDRTVLLAAAQKVGVTSAEAVLQGDDESKEVEADMETYQGGMNIRGVPHFIVDGTYQESGAIESKDFQEIFQRCLSEK
mmetsp:Transcript_103093/g.274097  ORF Transcript_103093/g.274097 Transcript_103093/m.274097 type:complete len:184 (-) Transcript_103093:17-568(-)